MITGSGTTQGNKNPAFTVIDFDEEFMVPINAHTFIANLTEANATPLQEPKWFELHDLLTEYELEDLSPSSMLGFINKMYEDEDTSLASQY